jgi:hypothetical protein
MAQEHHEGPDDVLYLSQVRQLFVEELGISERTFNRYFKAMVKPRLKSMTPTESSQMQFLLRREAMEQIDEVKQKGFPQVMADLRDEMEEA